MTSKFEIRAPLFPAVLIHFKYSTHTQSWDLKRLAEIRNLIKHWSPVQEALKQLTVAHLTNKFPTFYESWRLIIVFTRVTTASHPNSIRYILILSSHLRVNLTSAIFRLCFPTEICIPSMRATCHSHLILELITLIIFCEQYKLYEAPHCAVSSVDAVKPLVTYSVS
jgi:hypothetical protein